MKLIRILILEDDIETIAILTKKIAELDNTLPSTTISLTVLSEYYQVEEYVNMIHQNRFTIILLDRDCNIGGSFHTLNMEDIGVEKIISISSMPQYNEEAKKRGVSRVVLKDYKNLDIFADQVIGHIAEMIRREKTLYEKAKEIGVEKGVLSSALLQRELQISYSMTVRILDQLEEAGEIGPAQGSQPRQIVNNPPG